MKKFTTKQIAISGALLAIMIISMFFKNFSVYISGPIVNTVLLIATLSLGLVPAIILCIIAPIASFIITGSPVVAAAPFMIIPAIAIGNILICDAVFSLRKAFKNAKWSLPLGLVVGSGVKALFMGAVISHYILPNFCTSLPEKALSIAQKTFSITQFTTALIASVLVYIIWTTCGRFLVSENN